MKHFNIIIAVVVSASCAALSSIAAEVTRTLPHGGRIEHVSFSPKGDWLLSIDDDADARIWDIASRQVIRSFKLPGSYFQDAALSSDGKYLGVALFSSFNIVETNTGRILQSPPVDSYYNSIAFSPDARFVASLGTELMLWQVGKKTIIWSKDGFDINGAKDVIFSPGGKSIVTVETDGLKEWSLKGKMIRKFEAVRGEISTAIFSGDGKRIFAGGKVGIVAWDFESGAVVARGKSSDGNEVDYLALTPDGRGLLTVEGGDVTARTAEGKNLQTQSAHWFGLNTGNGFDFSSEDSFRPSAIAASLTSMVAISGSEGRLWLIDPSGKVELLGNRAQLNYNLEVSKAGDLMITGSSISKLNLWDLRTGSYLGAACKGHVNQFGFDLSGDGSTVFLRSEGNSFLVPDLMRCQAKANDTAKRIGSATRGWDIVASEDGSLVAFDGSGYSVVEASEGSVVHTQPGAEEDPLSILEFSPDGRQTAVSSNGATSKLWLVNLASGKAQLAYEGKENEWIQALRYSSDGSRLVAVAQYRVMHFNARTGALTRSVKSTDFRTAVSISPDLSEILLEDNAGMNVISAKTGRALRTIPALHSGVVSAARYIGNGDRIAVMMSSGTIHIIQASDGELILSLYADEKENWLAMTPEGFFAGSPGGASLVNASERFDVISVSQMFQSLYRPDLVAAKLAGDPDGRLKEAVSKLDLDSVFNSGKPPIVRLKAMQEEVDQPRQIVEVEAAIDDAGGGIGRIEWRIDGATLGVDTIDATSTITLRREFALAPGENAIEITAYNRANLIAAKSVSISLSGPAAKETKPRLFVLAVGVDKYENPDLHLNFPVADATAFSAAISERPGEIFDEVSVTQLLDTDVSAESIETAIERLATRVSPNDVFVFFLAGHGKTMEGRFYFIPPDFDPVSDSPSDGIGQDKLQTWLSRIAARKVLFLTDTCESGTLLSDQSEASGAARIAAIGRLSHATGRAVMAAAAGDAPALEGIDGHGVFTFSLLNGLGKADVSGNGSLEISELAAFVTDQVPSVSRRVFNIRQEPQISISGADFTLAPVVKDLVRESEIELATARGADLAVIVKRAVLSEDAAGKKKTGASIERGTRVKIVKPGNKRTLISSADGIAGWVATTSIAKVR